MTLHHPLSGATPSQILAYNARNARLARMAAVAIKPPVEAPLVIAEPVPEPTRPDKFAKWMKRQEYLNPIPKKLWFVIEDEPGTVGPTVKEIVRAVALHYGVKQSDMIDSSRMAAVVRPRQVCMYLCRTLTNRSYPEIGRRIGNKDHTTIMHGYRKIKQIRKLDRDLDAALLQITAAVMSGPIHVTSVKLDQRVEA